MDAPAFRPGRWFAVLVMKYFEGGGFWDRDAGMYLQGFQALGIDARFVALGEPAVSTDRPLILCAQAQMEDAQWWRQWNLEGVVLYSWALPRFTGIIRALNQAGIKVVLLLDTDGVMLPQIWPARYLEVKYHYAKASGKLLPWADALARTLFGSFTSRQAGTVEHLAYASRIALPSPISLQRYARFLSVLGRADLISKLVMIHHPVVNQMRYAAGTAKRPVIIAVGNWQLHLKGAPLLVRTLGVVLAREPAYSARLIGAGADALRRLVQALPSEVQTRIQVLGPVPHQQLPAHYQESQIILSTSTSESFGIACAEALCCGCSVVGLAKIGSMIHFCSTYSGTLAPTRSVGNYSDAVLAEISAWRNGERDPEKMSAIWTRKCHVENVARAVVSL